MSDLDDKLRDIWHYSAESSDELSKQISLTKQAFADEGYAHYQTVIKTEVNDQIKGIHDYYSETMMTGQEWYDRFKEELSKKGKSWRSKLGVADILDAAKRAAGIE